MNTNALRQKILDLAIHGKLVKQDPADESAAILLEKIRAEKEKKIASGKLKRGKNDSYIFFGDDSRYYEKFADGRIKDIEDEIPFALPEGWAWCRLGEIGVLERGITFPSSAKELSPEKNNIPCLRTANVQNNLDFSNLIYVNKVYLRNNHNKLLKKNDIILSSANSRELVGKTAFVYDIIDEMTFGGFVVVIRSFINNYLFYFLRREFFFGKFMEKSTQTTNIANIKTDTLANYFVPLPPLSEQQRIVAKIETIFAQIDLLEQNKVDLQTAVKQAKSKILDLAIRGKLVPQDPADEPASVMLEKLRAAKEAKIAAGEIKRGKNDSYIYKNSTDNCYYQKYTDGCEENISDEIPFDVPAGWAWCKLPEVCRKPITDGTHNSPSNSASGDFLYITAKNIKNLAICLDDATYISKEIHESIYSRCSPELNDILLTKDGTIGEVAVNNLNYPFSMLSSIALIKPSNEILSWFLAYILISDLLQNKMKKEAKGSALKRIILAQINDFLIPLPPLAEQQRIVTKIEELFAQFDSIIAALAD